MRPRRAEHTLARAGPAARSCRGPPAARAVPASRRGSPRRPKPGARPVTVNCSGDAIVGGQATNRSSRGGRGRYIQWFGCVRIIGDGNAPWNLYITFLSQSSFEMSVTIWHSCFKLKLIITAFCPPRCLSVPRLNDSYYATS